MAKLTDREKRMLSAAMERRVVILDDGAQGVLRYFPVKFGTPKLDETGTPVAGPKRGNSSKARVEIGKGVFISVHPDRIVSIAPQDADPGWSAKPSDLWNDDERAHVKSLSTAPGVMS